jgi:hypothetical protein
MADIKLFEIKDRVVELTGTTHEIEKSLQKFFEKNLQTLLAVDFLDTEYRTSTGRIDTLGIDENHCPVIIEYKRDTNPNVVNWPAPGSEDTELGVFMGPEVSHGETKVYAGVQA